jgi:hypothetical protein
VPSGELKDLTRPDTLHVPDPMSQSLLASATAPSSTSKHKTIELYNPSHVVEFKSTGTLTFRWCFSLEESVSGPFLSFCPFFLKTRRQIRHTFEWKRDSCYLIRKPDPAVLVAITKEVQARSKSTSVQILDYNLNRHVFPSFSDVVRSAIPE